jgi:hypothetical protein
MINEFLSLNLPPNIGNLCFQQDGATVHTAAISIAAFRRLFPQQVISRFGDVPWSVSSFAGPSSSRLCSVGLFKK